MTNFTSLFARLALALSLATGAGAALAVPASYHVDVDTSSLSGDGYLDLTFTGFSPATATVTHFMGNASGASILDGAVSGDLAGTAVFDTSGPNYLDQLVHFGGVFSLDVLFDYATSGNGVTFALQLYNSDFTAYLGANGPLATIELTPGVGTMFAANVPFASALETTAAAVPEPGQWLLMATGLLLLGATVRRRSV